MANDREDKKPIKRRGNDIKNLESAIRKQFPNKPSNEIRSIRSKIIDYVADGLNDGYDIAKAKQENGRTKIKVLKLLEQRRNGRLLSDGEKSEKEE